MCSCLQPLPISSLVLPVPPTQPLASWSEASALFPSRHSAAEPVPGGYRGLLTLEELPQAGWAVSVARGAVGTAGCAWGLPKSGATLTGGAGGTSHFSILPQVIVTLIPHLLKGLGAFLKRFLCCQDVRGEGMGAALGVHGSHQCPCMCGTSLGESSGRGIGHGGSSKGFFGWEM